MEKQFRCTQYSGLPSEEAASCMISDGYRQVSRKYRMVSRVDISKEEVARFFVSQSYGDDSSGVASLPIDDQMSQYRSCHSSDKIENVPEEIMMIIRKDSRSEWNELSYSDRISTFMIMSPTARINWIERHPNWASDLLTFLSANKLTGW